MNVLFDVAVSFKEERGVFHRCRTPLYFSFCKNGLYVFRGLAPNAIEGHTECIGVLLA